MPKLRSLPFETAIIERYRRRETSVEEALLEMYYAGVSMRRVEDITEALWGSHVSPSTVSELNQKVAGQIEAWRNQPIVGEHAYVFLDGIWLKRSWGGEVRNVRILRRHRRQPGRPPRGARRLRRHQGGQGLVAKFSAPPRRPRPPGRAALHRRQVPRPDREPDRKSVV